MSSFNLLDEKWIRVIMLDGSEGEMSLTEVIDNADRVRDIRGEISTQDFSILRLLLAITHRALDGPKDLESWLDAWDSTDVFTSRIHDYLETFRSRFDVRDSTVPFFQVAGIHAANDQVSGLEKLIADVPNSDQYFFAMRAGSGLSKISWAEASRWLIYTHAFDPSGIRTGAVGDPNVKGGRGYPIGPGWTGQIGGVYVDGGNLRKTILLNTIVKENVDNMGDRSYSNDLPPWEREPDGPAGSTGRRPTGPVDCYTWQSRRILLHGDDDGVTGLFLGNGDKATPHNRHLYEPMTAWRYSKPQTAKHKYDVFMPKQHTSSSSFWQGLPSLIPQIQERINNRSQKEGAKYIGPGVLNFYESLISENVVSSTAIVPIRAIGAEYGSQMAVIIEVINDSLVLPAALLETENAYLLDVVAQAIDLTRQLATITGNFVGNLAKALGNDPDLVTAKRESASSEFYQEIDSRFPAWLASLSAESKGKGKEWFEFALSVSRQKVEASSASVPSNAFSGRADGGQTMDFGRAFLFYESSVRKIRNREFPGTEEKVGDK